MRKLRTLAIASFFGTIFTAACHEVDTNPSTVNSVELVRFSSPSVVLGDTLRDTLGVVQPLQGFAFNVQGDKLPDIPIRFRALDTGVVVDSITGIVVGASLSSGPIRIIADARGLQTQPQTLTVTLRPDTVVTVTTNGIDSVLYAFSDTVLLSPELRLKVSSITDTGLVAVPSYLVSFAISSPSDTLLAQLVGDNGRTSFVDTTSSDGTAGRRIRIRPPLLTSATDSVVVLGTVKYRGVPLSSSPIRFVLLIKPKL